MGMGKTQNTGPRVKAGKHVPPVERDYVAEVQRRAEALAQAGKAAGQSPAATPPGPAQCQQVEREMATLRSEAVQARKLAEHIEHLTPETAGRKGNRVMAETPSLDKRNSQTQGKKTESAASSTAGQLNFNPLHPSMELPPEQLIRLLGLETRKPRKHKKRSATASTSKPARNDIGQPAKTPPESASGDAAGTHFPKREPERRRPEPRAASVNRSAAKRPSPRHRHGKRRSSLLFPAALVGALAGAGIVGYLLWHQPTTTATQSTAPATVRTQPAQPSATRPATRSSTVSTAKPQLNKAQPAASGTAVKRDNVKPNAAHIQAETSRLKKEAERRWQEKLTTDGAPQVPLPAATPNSSGVQPAPAIPAIGTSASPADIVEPAAPVSEDLTDDQVMAVENSLDPAGMEGFDYPAEPETSAPVANDSEMFDQPPSAAAAVAEPESDGLSDTDGEAASADWNNPLSAPASSPEEQSVESSSAETEAVSGLEYTFEEDSIDENAAASMDDPKPQIIADTPDIAGSVPAADAETGTFDDGTGEARVEQSPENSDQF